MRVTFLGTGAAGGVPLYGCACPACRRAQAEPAFVRRPACVLIENGATRLLLDAGLMDLAERFPPASLSAILLTHYHPDHVQGLFHLRWGVGQAIPVFAPPDSAGCADLHKHPGVLSFQRAKKFVPLRLGSLTISPLPLIHSKPTWGYAVQNDEGERFAYLTDTLGLPDATERFLKTWGKFELALDCTFPPNSPPANHNDWHTALASINAVGPTRTWLTHIGHQFDHWLLQTAPAIPSGIRVARDGQVVMLGG
ncbi:MAG: phosphonate metabolism protein PhnP [Betaproteobacteria bacterium]|nr:phosphonate metabolism protein PhnP [Betaproteobacteria bacterium]